MVTPAQPEHVLPRIVIAAHASHSGKTMLTTGILAALTRRGLAVSPHKIGPDYIDPGYHASACGRPGRNLDVHLVGPELIVPLLLHGAAVPEPADVAVIEGVMGLFDGQLGGNGYASSAHVATLTSSPVVLVVNCASQARSVGALVHGFATFDPHVQVAGVILNNLASPRHGAEARAALAQLGIPVLGAIPRVADVVVPSRHLGLIPAAERQPQAAQAVAALADLVEEHLDLDLMLSIAGSAPPLRAQPWSPQQALAGTGQTPPGQSAAAGANDSSDSKPVIAVAGGAAFTFGYTETIELLEAAGAQVLTVDPLHDDHLPARTAGLVLPGGFPQVHASQLADNVAMRATVAAFARAGGVIVAECAGLLYLAQSLDGAPMCAVLPIAARMTPKLTLGYRYAQATGDSVLAVAGERTRGHVFHRTQIVSESPTQHAEIRPAWELRDHQDQVEVEGYISGRVHASYLHTHWAGSPSFAARFVAAAAGA